MEGVEVGGSGGREGVGGWSGEEEIRQWYRTQFKYQELMVHTHDHPLTVYQLMMP